MSVNYSRFTSRYTYKVDAKYRVAIPSNWRAEAGDKLWLMSGSSEEVAGRKRIILKALTQEEFDERISRIQASPISEKEKASLRRRLASLCREVYVNDQNKLVIPKETADAVGIGSNEEVGMVGGGAFFEIWNERDYQDYLAAETGAEEDDEFGIF